MTDPWGNPLPEGVELHEPVPAPPTPPAPPASNPTPPPPANPAWPGRTSTPVPSATPAAPPAAPQWAPPPPNSIPPPAGWQPTPQWYPPATGPRTSGMAIASMVCGIVGMLCFGVVLGPVALGLGIAARRSIDASRGTQKGAGMAVAGIVLGIVATAFAILGMILLWRNPDVLDNLFTTTTTSGRGIQGA